MIKELDIPCYADDKSDYFAKKIDEVVEWINKHEKSSVECEHSWVDAMKIINHPANNGYSQCKKCAVVIPTYKITQKAQEPRKRKDISHISFVRVRGHLKRWLDSTVEGDQEGDDLAIENLIRDILYQEEVLGNLNK